MRHPTRKGPKDWLRRGLGLSRLAAGACAVLVGVGLLARSQAVAQGVAKGLSVCAGVLIPSLFPFMVLSGLISLTSLGKTLSAPLAPVTTRLFKLPRELGATVLLSLVGGYPVGAKSIAGLLEDRRISRKTAERMLCFCVNSGPSFLITAVGVGMFHQRLAGIILFATQTAATLLVGIGVSLRARPEPAAAGTRRGGGAGAFVAAVTGAANAMLAMCAFAVLFSGLLSLVVDSGIPGLLAGFVGVDGEIVAAVISGLLEVTSGCLSASALGGAPAFAMVSAMVSFGGLSVLFQIMSCFPPGAVSFRPLVLSRLAHCVLSTAMALPLYRRFCGLVPAWTSLTPPTAVADGGELLAGACLLGMCAILVLTARIPRK